MSRHEDEKLKQRRAITVMSKALVTPERVSALELMRKADKIVKEALSDHARTQASRRCY